MNADDQGRRYSVSDVACQLVKEICCMSQSDLYIVSKGKQR